MTTLNTDNKVLDAARLNVASVAGASASDHANNIKTAERFGINPAFADSPGINMRAIIENQRDVLTKLYATDQRFAGVTQGDHDNLVGVADSAKSLYGRNQPGPITAKQIASLLRVQGERPELPVGETTTTSRVGLLEGFSYGQNAVVRKGLLVYKQQQGGGLSLDEQNELDAINAAYPPGTETPDGLVSGLAFGVMSMTPFFKEALRSPADYRFSTGIATIVGAGTVSAGVGAAGGSLGGPAGAGVGGTLTFAGGAGTAAKLQAVLNIAKIEYGLAFDELSQVRDSEGNKLDPALVRSLSTLVGGINGGLEMVQFRVLAKSLGLDKIGKRTLMEEIKKSLADATTAGALKKIARKQAVTGFEQGGLESLQEITNVLAANIAERLSASPDNTFREDAPLITKENVSRITDAFQVGFAASVAFQSPATAVHIAASFTDAGKTEAANDAVRRLHAAAEKTRTKSIRPEALEQLVNEASPDKQMYLSTDDANVLLQEQPEAMEAMGVTSEVVAKAEATGDSIPVTPGKLASKLSKGQLDAVLQHTRPDADGVSEAEIESQETKEATKELKAVIDRTTEPERAVTREIERISKELTDIGASKEQVAANVSLLRGFADRMAFEGRDAAAIVGGIRIAGPDAPLFMTPDGGVLFQLNSEGPVAGDTDYTTLKGMDARRRYLADINYMSWEKSDQRKADSVTTISNTLFEVRKVGERYYTYDKTTGEPVDIYAGAVAKLQQKLKEKYPFNPEKQKLPPVVIESHATAEAAERARRLLANARLSSFGYQDEVAELRQLMEQEFNYLEEQREILQANKKVQRKAGSSGLKLDGEKVSAGRVQPFSLASEINRRAKQLGILDNEGRVLRSDNTLFQAAPEGDASGDGLALNQDAALSNRIQQVFPHSKTESVTLKYLDEEVTATLVTLSNGKHILVDERDSRIPFDRDKVAEDYGISPDSLLNATANGKYITESSSNFGVIQILKTADTGVLSHEKFHALMDLLLDDAEKQAILARYGTEEKAAEAFRRKEGFTRGLRDKATALLERIENAVRGDVFKTFFQAAPEGDASGDAAKPAKKKAIIGQLGLFGQKSRNPKVRAEAAAKPQTAPRGAVVIAEDGYIIKLLEGADASTLPHELAHVFLLEMDSLVSSGQASRDLVKAMAEIRKWTGLDIDTDLRDISNDKARAANEKFADGFTKWLSEGKAPNAQLDAAFNRFRRWLSTLFRRIRNAVTLTPEVRDAMARFISVEDEVRVGRYEAGVYALSEAEMKALGMTEDDRRKAQQYVSNASSGAASDILKKREKQRAKRVKRFRTAARKIVDASRPHQVMRDLTKEGGLDLEQLRRRHGDEVVRQLREKSSGFVKKDGRNLDAVAQQHGYGDADLMVRELMEAETPGKAIDNIVNDALARFDSLFGAKEAVQLNAEWSKYLDHVARFLKQATGRTEPKKLKAAFIRLARGEIARLPINQATRTDRFTGTAQRLIREQNRAIVKGDLETALVKNRQARLQLEMARESVKIRDIRAKLTRAIKRSVSAPLGKIDERYHDAIRQLGHRAGILRRGTFPLRGPLTDLSELVQPQDGSERLLGGPSFSPYLLGVQPIPLKNMTVGQAKELVDLVKYLDGKGREIAGTSLYVDGREIADVVAELIEPILDKPKRDEWNADTAIGKTLRAIQKYGIHHDSLAYLLQKMDDFISAGAKNKGLTGKHEALVERVLRTALLNRRKMVRETNDRLVKEATVELDDGTKVPLVEYISRRSKELHDLETSVPVFEGLKTKGVYKWTFETVFSVLLNRGNEHNLLAVADGYKTTVADVLKLIDDTLDDNDIAAAQAMWDMLGSYKDQLQEVHRKLYHYSFTEVEPTPFTSKSGKEYRGGYFPLKFDVELVSRDTKEQSAIDADLSHMSVFQKVVRYQGYFNDRLGSSGGRPVWLDSFQVFSSHLANVIDTISLDEPLVAVEKVFKDRAYQAAVVRAYGTDTYDAMVTVLNSLKRRFSPSDKINKTLEKTLNYSRSSINAYILSGPETVIKQPFALVNFAGEYGKKAALSGVTSLAKNPYRTLAFVREMSEFMRQRGQLLDRDLETNVLRKLGVQRMDQLKATHRTMVKIALAGLRFMDMFTATAAWMGAFNQRMELNGGNVEDAVQAADRAVANTQGSSLEIDLSPLQLSEGGLSRMFTYFSTFMFLGGGVLSRRGRAVVSAYRAGRITNTQFAFQMLVEFVVPPVMMNLMVGYLRDDDPDIEDIMLDLTLYQFSGLFILRDLTYYGGTLVKGRGNTRQSLVESPSLRPFEIIEDTISGITSLGFAMADDTIDPETRQRRSDRAMFAAIRLASFAAGIPVSEYYDRFEKGRQQIEQDDTLFRQMLRVLTPSRDPERDEK